MKKSKSQFKTLQLFQPFLLKKLLKMNISNSLREGKILIKQQNLLIINLLKKIIQKVWLIKTKNSKIILTKLKK